MDTVLNIISVLATFCVTFGLLYFVQRFTFGLLPFFKKEIQQTITVGDVVFSTTSLFFIIAFVDFYKPY